MHARTQFAVLAAAGLLAGAIHAGAADMTSAPATSNPLLAPWDGPYSGVPPFDRARPEHLGPALEAAMAENLSEVDRVANDPAAPSFENTIAAMERAGRTVRDPSKPDKITVCPRPYPSARASPVHRPRCTS